MARACAWARRIADRVRAALAGAGIHARDLRIGAPIEHQLVVLRDPDRLVLDLARIERSRELDELRRVCSAADPYIARDSRRSAGGRFPARRARSQGRGPAAGVCAETGCRVRASAGLDLYPVDAVDPLMALLEASANGRHRAPGAASRREAATTRSAMRGRASTKTAPARRRRSPSIPATAAKIRARSAGAAPTRRTSCWRSRAG